METIVIYITLIISIYILYLSIKNLTTICPYETAYVPKKIDPEPIKVSQIFTKMFQDASPIPGTINLQVGSEIVPNI